VGGDEPIKVECEQVEGSPRFAIVLKKKAKIKGLWRIRDDQGVSRAELASRLGTSRAYVTKMLRYGSNLTVHTIADVFTALGRTPRLVDRPRSVSSPPLVVREIPDDSAKMSGADLENVGGMKKTRNQA
jgi:transcriptional regulator with XRE-family HTH domain